MNPPDDVSPIPATALDLQSTSRDLQVLEGQSETAEAISRQARRLFTHAPSPMLLVTAAGRITDANVQAGQLLGLSPERLTGRRLVPITYESGSLPGPAGDPTLLATGDVSGCTLSAPAF